MYFHQKFEISPIGQDQLGGSKDQIPSRVTGGIQNQNSVVLKYRSSARLKGGSAKHQLSITSGVMKNRTYCICSVHSIMVITLGCQMLSFALTGTLFLKPHSLEV